MKRWVLAAGFVLVLLALTLVYETVTVAQDWRYPHPTHLVSVSEAAVPAGRARMVNAAIADAVAESGYDSPLLVIPEEAQELLEREPDMFGDYEQETIDRGLIHPFVAGRAVVRPYDARLTESQIVAFEDKTIVELPLDVYAVRGESRSSTVEDSSDDAVFLFIAPDGIRIYAVTGEVAYDVGLLP